MFGYLHPHPTKMVFLGVYDHILLHFQYISAEKLGLFEMVCVRTDLQEEQCMRSTASLPSMMHLLVVDMYILIFS